MKLNFALYPICISPRWSTLRFVHLRGSSISCIIYFLVSIMVALCNRADHYIFALLFLSSSIYLLFSSPNLSGRRLDVYHTLTHSANLECRSERCCTRLAASAGPKKSRQKSPSGHHHTTLSGYIFATKACIDNQKKIVKQQYLLYMYPQYGELRPSSG